MSIIDLKKFKMTPALAAHALQFLLEHPGPLKVETIGREEHFTGWGGRKVIRSEGFILRGFLRYEYTMLERLRGASINVTSTIDHFRNVAAVDRKEKENVES